MASEGSEELQPKGTLDEKAFTQDGWLAAKLYLENIPETASPDQLEAALEILKRQPHWICRMDALNILARNKYDEQKLREATKTDEDERIVQKLDNWVADYDGELLKYKLETDPNYTSNPFGNSWEELDLEAVNGIVAVIDSQGLNRDAPMIGLSAKQLKNLGLAGHGVIIDFGVQSKTQQLKELFNKGRGYAQIEIACNEETAEVLVYNSRVPGCGVRVSTKLAETLGVKRGDAISIFKPPAVENTPSH